MRRRILPRDDYWRLIGSTPWTGEVLARLPERTQMLVVEDAAGAIVACWAAIPYVHVEGVWTAPAHQKRAAVARHLMVGMAETVAAMGASSVWTAALPEDVATKTLIVDKLRGVPIPGEHFAVAL